MINLCNKCDKVLVEGDEINVTVSSIYHMIPSHKSWALSREAMQADSDSLCHKNCSSPKGGLE